MSRDERDVADSGARPSDSPEAWDRLIRQVGPATLLVVIESRMGEGLRRRLAPEDILQEALLHAWRGRDRYEWRGLDRFRTWLLAIIDNRIKDAAGYESALKRGGGESPVPLSAVGSPAADSSQGSGSLLPFASTTPSRMALYRERAAAMRAALQTLPDDVREVVRLRVFEQLSLEEIAERLGLSADAALRRFRKGAALYHGRLRSALTSGAPPESPRDSGPDSAPS